MGSGEPSPYGRPRQKGRISDLKRLWWVSAYENI